MSAAPPLFIGIDGGGTRCRARLRDGEGRLIGEGLGGPANLRLGTGAVREAIDAAIRAACEAGGLDEADLARAHIGLGLAGATMRDKAEALRARLSFASVALDTDACAAWLGAFPDGDGAILILGTGSCGFGVFGGEPVYVGGWGHVISDEGGGAVLGRAALRRSLWVLDGRERASALSDAVLDRFGRRPEAVVSFADTAKPSDFAEFAPLVFDHAARRDTLAVALLADAAEGAARIAARLLDLGAPSLALLGGLAAPLTPWLPPPIRARLAEPASDAMDGAILMARRSAGL